MPAARPIKITLSVDDLERLLDGLESRIYWDLSDQDARSSGDVIGDGSADPDARMEIRRNRALAARLEAARLRRG